MRDVVILLVHLIVILDRLAGLADFVV